MSDYNSSLWKYLKIPVSQMWAIMLMGIVFISFPFALPAKRCSCTPAMSVPIFCTVVINQICSFRQFNRQQCHFIVYSPLNQRRTHICCKALLHACIRGSLEKPQQQFTTWQMNLNQDQIMKPLQQFTTNVQVRAFWKSFFPLIDLDLLF